MTRFARAKGSKSSNEKAPADSTPWEVMKEQLLHSKKENEESKKRMEAEKQRMENYQNFLKEQKVQKKKATWCDFPETNTEVVRQPPKKKKKQVVVQNSDNLNTNKDSAVTVTKKKKKKNKTKTKTLATEAVSPKLESNVPESNVETDKFESVKGKKFKGPKQVANIVDTPGPKQFANNLDTPKQLNDDQPSKINNSNNNNQKNQYRDNKNQKLKKLVGGKPVRRKEINDNSFQLIINGKEVELVRFDGFPVMRKDAERLQDLKDNMIKKGIPKSEVQRTMKLERRRAEKALARVKREVCYNCRKGGHNLSDCPDLKSKIPGVDAAEGVCFKCGSTEHKQFECKVQKDMDFKFATCFICREPGHIARQCPDNPKGLYPNGGSCRLCGDVTHMRKDCPTVNTKKDETSIKLHTLDDDDNIEGIGQQSTSTVAREEVKKPKKISF